MLKLTVLEDNLPILVNPDYVVCIWRREEYTRVKLEGTYFAVKESVEDITKQLEITQ